MEFDHDRLYYRVIGDRPGYGYRIGELEAMCGGEGAQVAAYPMFEFDDIATVGKWFSLGDHVRVLRVPPDAQVEANRPMSQGGCMTYSADRIELLEVLDVPQFLHRLESSGCMDATVYLSDQRFTTPIRFPERCASVQLSNCASECVIDLPRVVSTLFLGGCELTVGRMTEVVDELIVRDCILFGVDALPRGATSEAIGENLLGGDFEG